MTSATSHPTAAHGSSITEVREMYGSTYGDSMYTSAAAIAPPRSRPSSRAAQRTPRPATSKMVPIHSRCATQSGTARCSMTQNHGPDGQR